MINLQYLMFSINNPSIAYDSNSHSRLSFWANSIKIDGTTYNLDSYPNALGLSVNIYNDYNSQSSSIGTIQITISVFNLDSNRRVTATSLFNGVGSAVIGKSIECAGLCTSTLSYDGNIPDIWNPYITIIGSSQQAIINGANITIVNNPLIDSNRVQYEDNLLGFAVHTANPIRIRANDGYILDASNIVITAGGRVLNDFITNQHLSDDNKEFTFDSVIKVDYGAGSVQYYLENSIEPIIPNLIITINAIQVPNENIVNTLSHVTNSNSVTSILNGARYQATLTASAGYYISDVIITMNGIDITNDVYSNGTIDIPSVTGEVVIIATGSLNPSITNNLSHCTTSNSATTIQYGARYQATITADNGYSLEGARALIVMGGVEQYYVYSNGVIDIPSVTGDLVIIIEANTIKTFTFKSMDGLTTYATYNAVKIRDIRFELNGNTRTLIVNGDSVASWVLAIPTGKQLYGLALTPNAERWNIPVNSSIIVNYAVDTTFYEVILDEGQEADMTSMILYKNSSDAHRVDKTDFLEYVGELVGVFRAPCSIVVPEVVIEYGVVNFNYVYIPIFKRYYYVSNVTYINKGLLRVSLKVDVLMSFKNTIYNQKGLIKRNEFDYNDELVDSERIIQNNPVIEKVDTYQSNEFFNADAGTIILDVIGGE